MKLSAIEWFLTLYTTYTITCFIHDLYGEKNTIYICGGIMLITGLWFFLYDT